MLNIEISAAKQASLCPCKCSEIADAISHLPTADLQGLTEVLNPYQQGQVSVVLRSAEAEELARYFDGVTDLEHVFVDHKAVKGFTSDSVITYVAFRREDGFELYRAEAEPHYMW